MVKRVLHIVNNKMGYGGIETLLMNIYRNIDTTKIQFDFAVTSREPGEYDKEIIKRGGRIFYIPSRRESLKNYEKNWDDFFYKYQKEFNAIHMHVSSLTDITPLKIAKKYNIKNRFIHSHNTYQKGIIHNILNKIHRLNVNKYATKLFACSSEAGRYCFGNRSFGIIKNGINTDLYKYSLEKRIQVKKEIGFKENETSLVHVGRFMEQKNHTFLIDVFYELLKKDNNFVLYLIGDGELKRKIENKVKYLNIEDKVKFLGLRNDVNLILQGMDIFLLPSLHEGLPVVGIEAQASGLECIMSENISKEVKITNLVHFLPINDVKEWVDLILDKKNYVRKDVQEKIIQQGYDIKQTTKKLEKLYIKYKGKKKWKNWYLLYYQYIMQKNI